MADGKTTDNNSSVQALRLVSSAWSESTLPLAATAEALLRGEELNLPSIEERYIEGTELGRGGLGRVVRAYDKRLGRQIALKEKLKGGANAEARFFQEVLITAQLEHPSIIPIYDFGRKKDGAICYTMKLVSGKTLTQAIAEKPLLGTRLPLLPHVLSVCEAIAYAHSKKIIHRDLKPHNILVGEFGETVLIDWGIAKEIGARGQGSGIREEKEEDTGEEKDAFLTPDPRPLTPDLTQEGSILGTPAYMPPEQARGDPVHEAADVYSLGAILYHLICGKAPYQGKNSREILESLLRGPPPAIEEKAPLAPKDLQAIIRKAMERDPKERYPTAKEFVQDLKNFLAGQAVVAHRYTLVERMTRFFRKHRILILLWSLLPLMLLGVTAAIAGFTYSTSREEAIIRYEAKEALKEDPTMTLAWLKEPLMEEEKGIQLALQALQQGVARHVFHTPEVVDSVAFSSDGLLIEAFFQGKPLQRWALSTGEPLSFTGSPLTPAAFMTVSPTKELQASIEDRTTILLQDAEGKTLKRLRGHQAQIVSLVFSSDGEWLASAAQDKTLRLWRTTQPIQRPPFAEPLREWLNTLTSLKSPIQSLEP